MAVTDSQYEIHKLAYDEAVRTLSAQTERLTTLRTRVITFLGGTTVSLAFFAKVVLDQDLGSGWVTGLIVIAGIAYGGQFVSVVVALRPQTWKQDTSAKDLIEIYADGDFTASETFRHVAAELDDDATDNSRVLASLQWWVWASSICVATSLGCLAAAAVIAVAD